MVEFKKDDIIDDYHGVKVADPYRWLEEDDSVETKRFVSKQNKKTADYLHSLPSYQKIKEEMTELWNYTRYSVPEKAGLYYYFFKNDGLQNQAILYCQKGLEGKPEVVLDPNKFSEDGTVALINYSFNREGTILAYGLSRSGSDWQEIKIRNLREKQDYKEVINWVKFSSIAWSEDSVGFYYSRFPEPQTVSAEDQNNYNAVYYHTLGTPQSADVLVYEDPDNKEFAFDPIITDDGKYLILTIFQGTSEKNKVYYRQLNGNSSFIRLLDNMDASYTYLGNDDTVFYFSTNLDAPKGRIIAIDILKPQKEYWQEIITEEEDALNEANIIQDKIVLTYMHDAYHKLKLCGLNGEFIKEIELPFIGSITNISLRRKETVFFFGLTSYLYPGNIYYYDLNKDQLIRFYETDLKFVSSDYLTEQVFYTSKDGAKIPMFITRHKDLQLDGNNPTLLYGYGGFNISLTPAFSPSVLCWLKNGGVYVVANLRGGSEYGDDWHQAGMLDNKQNVFDDFISAAEWLIDNKYTKKDRLAIMGRSNGGLLTASCLVQRPDLFGAVVCNVPVIDMLRYHKFTVGRYWIPEYGNAEKNPDHFKFMYDYSPLHNVQKGISYPATIIGTAETDDRVAPLHARKFAATLQEANEGSNPILLRVEDKAGHGFGKPTYKIIEEETSFYTFICHELDVF